MAKPNSIKFIEDFKELVWVEVTTRFGEFATPKDVIYHLSEKGLIEPTRLRNYLILKDFDKFLVKNGGHVTHTFMDLSIKYNLSDRQVQGIVYKYRSKFSKEANIKKGKRVYTFKHTL
jgi:hypothetical protein|tara:strand:+ start:7385 stop:7738 length:354 start_codon:yes stop_codon:yes gene_type:complete